MLILVSKEEDMMDKQIKNEMDYQLLYTLMNNFLKKGLLTKEEFEKIKQELLQKYEPYISELLAKKLD